MKNIVWVAIVILSASCFSKKNETMTEVKSIRDERPSEFVGLDRSTSYGNLSPIPVEYFTLETLQSCSWHRNTSSLLFSKEDNYAIMDIDNDNFGKYTLTGNKIIFNPPIELVRFAENYTLAELYYSNEMYLRGFPVLTNDEESVIFTPIDPMKPKDGEIVKIQNHYCEKITEDKKIESVTNNILFALPDISSKNLFKGNFYGGWSKSANISILAKTTINDVVWYYTWFDFSAVEPIAKQFYLERDQHTWFDFSAVEPIDFGGLYYEGWISEKHFTIKGDDLTPILDEGLIDAIAYDKHELPDNVTFDSPDDYLGKWVLSDNNDQLVYDAFFIIFIKDGKYKYIKRYYAGIEMGDINWTEYGNLVFVEDNDYPPWGTVDKPFWSRSRNTYVVLIAIEGPLGFFQRMIE